jgi:hypothetical protein
MMPTGNGDFIDPFGSPHPDYGKLVPNEFLAFPPFTSADVEWLASVGIDGTEDGVGRD